MSNQELEAEEGRGFFELSSKAKSVIKLFHDEENRDAGDVSTITAAIKIAIAYAISKEVRIAEGTKLSDRAGTRLSTGQLDADRNLERLIRRIYFADQTNVTLKEIFVTAELLCEAGCELLKPLLNEGLTIAQILTEAVEDGGPA